MPSNKDKGIEMDEDFDADTFSVSEDSEDSDNDDEQDINLESKMGETGDDKQVVDEKLWNKDEDDKPDSSVEKYESGPSVKETESSDRELRAKEGDAPALDESGEPKNNKPEELPEEDNKHNISDDEDNNNDMNLDKNDAFEDATGIQLSEQEQNVDDVMEDAQDSDAMQENDSGPGEPIEEVKDDGEQPNPADRMDDQDSVQVDDNMETKEGVEDAGNTTTDIESGKDEMLLDKNEPSEYPAHDADSLEPSSDSHNVDFSMESEMRWSNTSDMNTSLVPSRSSLFDGIRNMQLSLPDSGDNSGLAPDQPKPQVEERDTPSAQKSQSNPYRSIGDAMQEWKERVKVSIDPQEAQREGNNDIDEENADEYRYVFEAEKSTSQALGSATADQINDNVDGKKTNQDESDIRKREEIDRMDSVEENLKTQHFMASQPSGPKQKADEKVLDTVVSDDEIMEEMQQNNPNDVSGDMVSFKSSYMNEKTLPLDTTISGVDTLQPMDVEELPNDFKQKVLADWKRYELSTSRLSQELTEHLRLVMEPTLASKLQGDYRTGKRINMKKASLSFLFCQL